MVGLIEGHEFCDGLKVFFAVGVGEKLVESLVEGGVDEDDVEVVAFLELEQQFAVDGRRQEDCSRGLPELPEAHFPHVFCEGHVRRTQRGVCSKNGEVVVFVEDLGDFLDAAEGEADEEDSQDLGLGG